MKIQKLLFLITFVLSCWAPYISVQAAAAPGNIHEVMSHIENLSQEEMEQLQEVVQEQQKQIMDLQERVASGRATPEEIAAWKEFEGAMNEMFSNMTEEELKELEAFGQRMEQDINYKKNLEKDQFVSVPSHAKAQDKKEKPLPKEIKKQEELLDLIQKINKHLDTLTNKIQSHHHTKKEYDAWKEKKEFQKIKQYMKHLEDTDLIKQLVQESNDNKDLITILKKFYNQLHQEHKKIVIDDDFGLEGKQQQSVLSKMFTRIKQMIETAIDDVLPFVEKFFEKNKKESPNKPSENKDAQKHEALANRVQPTYGPNEFQLHDAPAPQHHNNFHPRNEYSYYQGAQGFPDMETGYRPRRRHAPGKPQPQAIKPDQNTAKEFESPNLLPAPQEVSSDTNDTKDIEALFTNTSLEQAYKKGKQEFDTLLNTAKKQADTFHRNIQNNPKNAGPHLGTANTTLKSLQPQAQQVSTHLETTHKTLQNLHKKTQDTKDKKSWLEKMQKSKLVQKFTQGTKDMIASMKSYLTANDSTFNTIEPTVASRQQKNYKNIHKKYQDLHGIAQQIQDVEKELDNFESELKAIKTSK